METFAKDLRFAARSLRKQPAFTLTVIATLAIAIGGSTAIFSVVEATLLRGLPFRDASRLVLLQGVAGPQRAVRGGSIIEVQDWARRNRTLDGVSIYDETSLSLRTSDGAERVEAELVSASYFPTLGASAQIGRVFGPTEDRVPDEHPVVVISDGMWRNRFAGDRSIVGRTITLNDRPFTVVGVMEAGFRGISFDTDVWFPSMMARIDGAPQDMTQRGSRWLGAIGRLRDGVTLEQAQRDLDRVAGELTREYPESNRDRGVQLVELRDGYLGRTSALVLALFGAVGLFALIACTNVVSLQLVRTDSRHREIALRMAIGASRRRLVQQLVAEGLTLGIAAAAAGFAIAHWSLAGLVALAPDGVLPSYAQPSIDLTAAAFATALALVSGVALGVVPAFRASRIEVAGSLKEGARTSPAQLNPRSRFGGRQLIVIAETAMALVLLVGSGLMVRSLQRQLAVDPGFDPTGVLRARVVLPQHYTTARRTQFVDELQTRLGAIASISAVTIGSDVPLGGSSNASFLYVPDADDQFRYYRHFVTPSYFSALGIRLVSGRPFTTADRYDTPGVVMISEAMAQRVWPGRNPIGRRVRLGGADGEEATVVGVVGNVRFRDLTSPLSTTEPDVYFAIAQAPARYLQIAVRSTLPSDRIVAAVRREVAALDATIPVFGVRPLADLLAQQTARGRFGSAVLSAFGVAALVLAAVGLYGLLAYVVSLRRREIGIRLALGATSSQVLEGVIGHGVRLAAAGVVAGLIGAFFTTRMIESQLFDVNSRNPFVFGFAALAMLIVAVAASWIPARRAARVDPQIALRSD